MGKIRQKSVIQAGNALMEHIPDIITTDFDINKEIVTTYTDITSKKLRNQLAGYLVNLKINEDRIIIPPKKVKKVRSKKDRRKKQRKRWI